MSDNEFGGGWIKVYRQIRLSPIWDTQEEYSMRDAWIDLLMSVNYESKEVIIGKQNLIVGRGQKFTSVRKLADRWKWSPKRTLAYLRLLEGMQMITREVTLNGTLLTIVNYDFYQGRGNTFDNTNGNTNDYTSDNTTVPQYKKIKKQQYMKKGGTGSNEYKDQTDDYGFRIGDT